MTIDDDIALLERVPSFRVLGQDALRVLAIGAESRVLEQGAELFREGEAADGGYVVELGALIAVPKGRYRAAIRMDRGTLIGELALLTETRRPVTVSAVETSSVMRIARPLFLKMLQGYPEAAERLRQVMLMRTDELAGALLTVRRGLDIGAPPNETAKA